MEPTKNTGTISPPLEACPQGQCGQQQLQQEYIPCLLLGKGGKDGFRACAVVHPGAQQQTAQHHQSAACCCPQVGILQKPLVTLCRPMDPGAEHKAQQTAHQRHCCRLAEREPAEPGHQHLGRHGAHAEEPGYGTAGDGGGHTGQQGGVVQHPDADDLHGEKGGGYGSAEQGGEAGAHAGHHQNPAVRLVQLQHLGEGGAHAAADLEGSAFSAAGAAA